MTSFNLSRPNSAVTAIAVNEGSPSADGGSTDPQKRTPIPWLQLSLVLLVQVAEPIVSKVIFPFVNQFVRSTGITGGDDAKTGYFSGRVTFTMMIGHMVDQVCSFLH